MVSDITKLVEPDRVRREVYTDPAIFELEMRRIHETVWIYCGHETQIPSPGDYYAVQIGRQPMLMVRGKDAIHVLYNRCPHRDRKSTRLNSSHLVSSYAVCCLKKKEDGE